MKDSRRLITILSVLLGLFVCLLMVTTAAGALLVYNRLGPTATLQPTTAIANAPTATSSLMPTETATPSPNPTTTVAMQLTNSPIEATETLPPTAAAEPTEQPAPPMLENCGAPPVGWALHQVQPGETLFAYVIGSGGTTTTSEILTANCLTSDLLMIGQTLYLPRGAAENAPSSDPLPDPGVVTSGPRTPNCDPHCTISIRPGSRAEQVAQTIDTIPLGFWGSDFLAAIAEGSSVPAYDFLASKPAGQTLEGYLYPGTYELSNSTTAADFRDMLLAAFAAQYAPSMDGAAAAHGLTFYEALTLASIIQRESWAYSEQVLISSVFHNHLRNGTPYGSSVTTQYAYGQPGNWWPRVTGTMVNTNNPYNTNMNAGLPPSPIDSPSNEAIQAALNPAATDFLFFTGNCQGSGNLYAQTFDEHLANVNLCN